MPAHRCIVRFLVPESTSLNEVSSSNPAFKPAYQSLAALVSEVWLDRKYAQTLQLPALSVNGKLYSEESGKTYLELSTTLIKF